jgi:hypothetical protein
MMSGQLHNPTTLPLGIEPAPSGQKFGRAPEPVWTLWYREKCIELNHCCSESSPSLYRLSYPGSSLTCNALICLKKLTIYGHTRMILYSCEVGDVAVTTTAWNVDTPLLEVVHSVPESYIWGKYVLSGCRNYHSEQRYMQEQVPELITHSLVIPQALILIWVINLVPKSHFHSWYRKEPK